MNDEDQKKSMDIEIDNILDNCILNIKQYLQNPNRKKIDIDKRALFVRFNQPMLEIQITLKEAEKSDYEIKEHRKSITNKNDPRIVIDDIHSPFFYDNHS